MTEYSHEDYRVFNEIYNSFQKKDKPENKPTKKPMKSVAQIESEQSKGHLDPATGQFVPGLTKEDQSQLADYGNMMAAWMGVKLKSEVPDKEERLRLAQAATIGKQDKVHFQDSSGSNHYGQVEEIHDQFITVREVRLGDENIDSWSDTDKLHYLKAHHLTKLKNFPSAEQIARAFFEGRYVRRNYKADE